MNKSNDRSLLDSFEANFRVFRDESVPIALYGIGIKTQLLLDNVKGFNIVGLMDKDTVGKSIYGHPVLSYEEVIAEVKLVIIVANLSVIDLIYRRISFLKNHGIRIFSINGSELAVSDERLKSNTYFNSSSNTLKAQIDSHDVISFDLFDTLIMRRVFSPRDIFDLVEGVLIHKYSSNLNFKVQRIKAEQFCFNEVGEYFNIDDVYNWLKERENITSALADEMMRIELSLERKNCIPRSSIVTAMRYANRTGKYVCITTDTYLREEHVLSLIKLNKIPAYNEIHVSCEKRKSKADGSMWQYFKEIYGVKKILHIGDNPVADIENALKAGIDAFEVKNAMDLIGVSSANLRKYTDHFENRLMLGHMSAYMLNDPFIFHQTKGLLKVNTMYDVGYLSFGPMVLNFLLWLIRTSKEHRISKLLFFSRDGYLLERLYQKIVAKFGIDAPKSTYFLTSRRAASVASVFNSKDISFVIMEMCNIKKTAIGDILQIAFGVCPDKDDTFLGNSFFEVSKDQVIKHIIMNYSEQIFENSAKERDNYNRYIASLGILEDNKIGCVNYVGRGVTQRCISKIIGKDLYGYYFATQNEMLEVLSSQDNIFALYGKFANLYTERSSIISKCLFGEVVLSAPDEQLIKFTETGEPLFQRGRGKRNYSPIDDCHQGITKYVDDLINIDINLMQRSFNIDIIDRLYDLFSSNDCILSEEVKSSFVFNDYYDPDQIDIRLLPT